MRVQEVVENPPKVMIHRPEGQAGQGPLDRKTSRHARECQFASETDPAVLRLALKVKDGAGEDYHWVTCSRATDLGRFRATPRASRDDEPALAVDELTLLLAECRVARSLFPVRGGQAGRAVVGLCGTTTADREMRMRNAHVDPVVPIYVVDSVLLSSRLRRRSEPSEGNSG